MRVAQVVGDGGAQQFELNVEVAPKMSGAAEAFVLALVGERADPPADDIDLMMEWCAAWGRGF